MIINLKGKWFYLVITLELELTRSLSEETLTGSEHEDGDEDLDATFPQSHVRFAIRIDTRGSDGNHSSTESMSNPQSLATSSHTTNITATDSQTNDLPETSFTAASSAIEQQVLVRKKSSNSFNRAY